MPVRGAGVISSATSRVQTYISLHLANLATWLLRCPSKSNAASVIFITLRSPDFPPCSLQLLLRPSKAIPLIQTENKLRCSHLPHLRLQLLLHAVAALVRVSHKEADAHAQALLNVL